MTITNTTEIVIPQTVSFIVPANTAKGFHISSHILAYLSDEFTGAAFEGCLLVTPKGEHILDLQSGLFTLPVEINGPLGKVTTTLSVLLAYRAVSEHTGEGEALEVTHGVVDTYNVYYDITNQE